MCRVKRGIILIIDAHVHVTENGKWFNTNHDASIGNLIRSLNQSSIDKAVVLPIAPVISNEFVAKICKEYPDQLIGFASVDPFEKSAELELEKAVVDLKLKGLKLHPKIQNFKMDSQTVIPVIKKAADLKIPVLIDGWIRPIDTDHQNLLDSIYTIAREFPNVNIVLAHLGGFKFKDITRIANTDNIYFDLSFVLTYFNEKILSEQIAPILIKLGASKLIYGSDHPEIDMNLYYKFTLNLLKSIGFNSKDINKIFRENISQLLKL